MIVVQHLEGGGFAVVSPYDKEFVRLARSLGGRWRNERWMFPAGAMDRVRAALHRVYGWSESATLDRAVLHLRARETIVAQCDGIRLGGRTIAYAWARDSGARLGEGVLSRNAPSDTSWYGSGGSLQYWTTWVREGAEFEMLEVYGEVARRLTDGTCKVKSWDVSVVANRAQSEFTIRDCRLAEVRAAIAEHAFTAEEVFGGDAGRDSDRDLGTGESE